MSDSQGVLFQDSDFRKSSFTGIDRWACVAVAHRDGVVAVRSTTDAAKKTVYFTDEEWTAFIAGVKNAEFDL